MSEAVIAPETERQEIEFRVNDGTFVQVQRPDERDARGNLVFEVDRRDHGERTTVTGPLVSVRLSHRPNPGEVLEVRDTRGSRFYRIGDPLSPEDKRQFPNAAFGTPLSGRELEEVKASGNFVSHGEIPYSKKTQQEMGLPVLG